MYVAFVIGSMIALGISFDLGRKWERMKWDGDFDEEEAPQQSFAPDGLTPRQKEEVEQMIESAIIKASS